MPLLTFLAPLAFLALSRLLSPFLAPLEAQTLRDFAATRPLAGEARLELRLALYEGVWRVTRGDSAALYAVELIHDASRFKPVTHLDPQESLRLGLRGESRTGFRLAPPSRLVQEGSIRVSPEVEWNLQLELGSSEAELDLAGISFGELSLDAAASRTTVRFPEPNPVLCRRALVTVAAGELLLDRLGNSGCRELEVAGRLGRLVLDFTGAIPGDIRGTLDLKAGTLVLRFPEGLGVRIATDRILSRLHPAGLIREGDAFVSEGYSEASRKVDLRLSSLLGSVSVEWVSR
jgi:hypothetical protein